MRRPEVDVELHWHAGAAELGRVGGVLVAEHVDLADLYVRGRQACRLLQPGWSGRRRDLGPAERVEERAASEYQRFIGRAAVA